MRIAIVDDEQRWIDDIIKNVKRNVNSEDEIEFFTSGRDFIRKNEAYDMVFMDVEIKDESGFDVSAVYKQSYPQTILVILTTHTELSRKGYKVNAFRYIDKLHLEEIDEAVLSAKKRMVQEDTIEVKIGFEDRKELKIKNILYCEARGHKVEVVTYTDRYEVMNSMSQLNEKLKSRGFFQIHRSYIVNLEYIKSDTNKDVYISNGDVINMSRRKYGEYKQALFDWKIERGYG